jgi:hypothetical protein
MAGLAGTFGIAVQNFTAYPQMPDIKALVEYGVRMEQLGFDSLWVWDHILLGVDPNFPIIESLTLLTAIAARTSKIKLGTGILVLPMRNPVILAKQLACMDLRSDGRLLMGMASGWYRREFNAIGVPFEQRGKIMDENLDILKRFWTEHTVSGKFPHHDIPAGVMFPKPVQKPHPPILIGGYVDRVLKGGPTNDYYTTANNESLRQPGFAPLLDDIGSLPETCDRAELARSSSFWFGPAGTVTPLHHDTLMLFHAQVVGRKRWRFISPLETPKLYNFNGVFSPIDVDSPDLSRYPLFADVTMLEVVVEPGETVFLPLGWWHQVTSLDVSLSFSYSNLNVPNHFNYSNPTMLDW